MTEMRKAVLDIIAEVFRHCQRIHPMGPPTNRIVDVIKLRNRVPTPLI